MIKKTTSRTAKRGTSRKSATKSARTNKATKKSTKKAAAKKSATRKSVRKTAARKQTPKAAFEIRTSAIQGRGAFATRDIRKGDVIGEYKGERISSREADRRYPEKDGVRHHTFLFETDDGSVIDATRRGNAAKYINHSCEPNCEAVEDDDGRIWIHALKNIGKGKELLYDYHFILDEPHTPAAKRRYPCLCGARTCRGTILAKKR